MDLKDCVKFATENPVCYLATTEGDQPRVRALLMWFANEEGFHFATFSPKQMTKQLEKNPKVEICFYNNASDLGDAKAMRVTGEVHFLEDEELTKKIAKERGFLEQMAGQPLERLWRIFRLYTGEAHFWTMGDVLKEADLERIGF
jgi:pyridoxamine 5'-phosphate oxidase